MQQKLSTRSNTISMIKALRKLGIEGKYLNIIKAIYDNLQPTLYLMVRN
jgi:hypothetical protein